MRIVQYHDIVIGEAIVGANIFRDYFAKIRDIVGGRSAAYEKAMNQARRLAFNDLMETAASLGANAVIGIDLNCGVIDKRGSMLLVSITGTAISVAAEPGLNAFLRPQMDDFPHRARRYKQTHRAERPPDATDPAPSRRSQPPSRRPPRSGGRRRPPDDPAMRRTESNATYDRTDHDGPSGAADARAQVAGSRTEQRAVQK